jgi:hypothetical protein
LCLQNLTAEDIDIARLRFEIEDVTRLLFVITEVLSFAILLVFILLLVLAWRVNR